MSEISRMFATSIDDGQRLASWQAPGEEILITGISGNFPDSDSVNELADNLFNKVDLISDDDRRWKGNHLEIPQRTGKINNIEKFDASFFNIDYKEAHVMEPGCRILMEKVYEALIDAGVNPEELRNTNTGVFAVMSLGECEWSWYDDRMQVNDFGVIGRSRSMLAHRVSAWLGVRGPSHVLDTACSSSLYAFELAYKSILRGQCDAAIVCSFNLCLSPLTSLQSFRMGTLSAGGRCKSFDNDADGYARSETIAACFLQKAKDSRRVYAQVIHAKTNCDGYKVQGISYPARRVQKLLLNDFYEECGIPPTMVEYVEAHVTGTKVGDPEEMSAIDEVFCTGRSGPLLIGAVKSNLGHAEASSGMCGIAKMCIAYNTGFIPPNINFKTPRKEIEALHDGRVHVVTEKQPWDRGLAAVNSFGFGGANAHTLLKNFAREKVMNGLPSDDLPRLVCVSGRTEAAVNKILDELLSRPVDVEQVRLWHAIHARDIPGHPLRGYVLLGSTPTGSVSLSRDVQHYSRSSRAVWFKYSSLNPLSPSLVSQLMRIKVFADAIKKCHEALIPKSIDLMKIITSHCEDNLLHSLLTTSSVHIGLTDLLKAIGIKPDYLCSRDIGKLACAYADGLLNAEQVILATFSVGQASTANPFNTDLQQYLTDVMPSLEAHAESWSSEPQSDAVVIELAPSEQIWSQNKNIASVVLTQENHDDPIVVLFTALGILFELGLNLQLANIYPDVTFPVSLGTPMLSHLVEWQHSDNWSVLPSISLSPISTLERSVVLSLQNEDLKYLSGHVIDGRIVVPGTCYLVLVWETLALYLAREYSDVSVVFDNVSLHRLTYMPVKGSIELVISLQWKSGNFEVMENGSILAKGRIRVKENIGKDYRAIPPALIEDDDDDVMINTKDFYKERHLQGFEYKDAFCGVLKQSVSGTKSCLTWIYNWVSFLDNILQSALDDSRNLRVPLRFDRIAIDVEVQKTALERNISEEKYLQLRIYPEINIIRCGGVEMRGLHVATISRKPARGIPVFEKSEFVSNYSTTKRPIEDVIRANLQLVHENIQSYKFKSIELVDEEYKIHKLPLLTEKVADVLADLPLVQADLVVLSEEPLELPQKITVLHKNGAEESNAIIFIGANLLKRTNILQQALDAVKDGCFIVSREITLPAPQNFPDYSIITIHNVENENIVLLRRKPNIKPTKFIKILTADPTFSWIDNVKGELKDGQKLVLYSQGESVNGLLGLVNCLRKEPGGETVSGVLIADPQAPEFNPELQLYKEQLNKDLGINVYINGQWGTYRHLLLEDLKPVPSKHAYVNYTTIGDLSSLRWLEGSIKDEPGKCLIHQSFYLRSVLPSISLSPISTLERSVVLSLQNEDLKYLSGHVIDGRIVVPGTCYLVLVWETLALYLAREYSDVSVVFDNVSLHRLTYMPVKGSIELVISLQWKSGNFEVMENGSILAKGRIRVKENIGKDYRAIPPALIEDDDDDVMINTKDFYKERHLQGFEYKDAFCGVLKQSVSGTKSCLTWIYNWVSFLDNILQSALDDSRNLRVPLRFDRIAIDVEVQKTALERNISEEKYLQLRIYPEINIIRCGGVEMRGLHVATISRKPARGIPVFEKSEFVSNYSTTKRPIEDVIRANLQLVHENIQSYKFKSIELVDEEYKIHKLPLLTEKVADVLADLPLVQADLVVLSEEPLELPQKITVLHKNGAEESNAIIFIGANLLKRTNILQQALDAVKDGCFIVSREITLPAPQNFPDYSIITIHNVENENIVLLRRKPNIKPTKFIKILTADPTFSWIDNVKGELKDGQKLVLYSQGESVNGLLGLVNCLRKEPGGETVSGVLIADPQAPEFNPELQLYKEQLNKDLGINVYINGQWGTYRHLLLEDLKPVPSKHAYVNYTTIGDLSSLRWLEGSIKDEPGKCLIHVYCAAVNFRDVMTALGRVTVDAVAHGRIAQECVQGVEVVGRTANGSRVMALYPGICNTVNADKNMVLNIPDEWSFEEAATVPVVYSTVYLALLMVGKLKRGESVLIHSGAGGVGQAAINVALHHGCEVFTTVGTPDKRAFIKRVFPQIKDSHIGNSRDTSFEDMIRRETNGRGVNIVLNALADDKLLASTRCLGRRGRFLEMGKYDITKNTLINLYIFKKEISFHGIMLDYVFDDESVGIQKTLQNYLMRGIQSGAVRPITYVTFEKNELEAAYRYMAAGKHIGKIIIKIREEEKEVVKPKLMPIHAVPRYACDGDHVYVLVGGLGGFGMELADWLILRRARKLILNSRRGISNGYQRTRLRAWKSYGADVRISTHDATLEAGCKELLAMANAMGTVSAVFNLAVVLKDAVFTNQTPETFKDSFRPKAQATINLDKFSRKMCPELRDFVIFSSVSCGRGNAGQTNYGFSNSVMERICEERRKHGLPALAIQWGAIGDVGLVADMQENNILLEIGGTLQQRISSCLQAMDRFLRQDATIVSSIVVAEKRSGAGTATSSVEVVAQIMGIEDYETVSKQAVLAELGLDSIMVVEIKQTLEREFEIFFTAQEIRSLTFARLNELTAQTETSLPSTTSASVIPGRVGLDVLMRNIGDEDLAYKTIINLPSKASIGAKIDSENRENVLFLVPGLESSAAVLAPLCSNLDVTTCALQLGLGHRNDTMEDMVDRLHKVVKQRLAPGAPFRLLGYSFGSLIVLELAAKLESEGHDGIVICLDGAPDFSQNMAAYKIKDVSEREIENIMILHVLNMVAPNSHVAELFQDKLNKITSLEERIVCAIKLVPVDIKYSTKFQTEMTIAGIERLKALVNYKSISNKLKSPIVLLRQKELPPYLVCEENYSLDKCTESTVTVHKFDNDHITIVDNVDCANVINEALATYTESRAKSAVERRFGN